MERMAVRHCNWCGAEIRNKDEVGLNLKLLGASTPDFYCMDCLAEYCGCTVEDLEIKIAEFKQSGCTLFS